MNMDCFKTKRNLITLSLILGYVCLHFELTNVLAEVGKNGNNSIQLPTRLPFAQRMLIPFFCQLLQRVISIDVESCFFIFELLFASLLYCALLFLFSKEVPKKEAELFSWIFFLLLPLLTLLNYRYPVAGGKAPFYWYYDTPTLFFMALGLALCLRKYWHFFGLLVFFATLNRESGFLLVLLIPVLHRKSFSEIIRPFCFACLAFILAKLCVFYWVSDYPGPWVEFIYFAPHYTNFEINLMRLFGQHQILYFVFFLSALPVFWFAFYDFILPQFRPLKYLAFIYFLGLLMVGHITEGRIFQEIFVLLYLPVCLAIRRFIMNEEPILETSRNTFLFYCDRYAILTSFCLLIIFRFQLIHFFIYLKDHGVIRN